MATSRCASCGSTFFEAAEANIAGTDFPYVFIQCVGCGAVVGVSEAENVPNLVHRLARRLGFELRI